MTKLRVLLADDHAVLRAGLAMLIDSQADMSVVSQASNSDEAISQCREQAPDVVVLDVSMPGSAGLRTAESIRDCAPHAQVLALTRHSGPGYVNQLLRSGARGYVLKRSGAEQLLSAIRVVAQGGTYIDPSLAGALVSRAVGQTAAATRSTSPVRAQLSEREEDVLRMIAWGLSNKEVAIRLDLSVKTVESYKATASQKLGLRTRADILRHALSQQWLDDDAAPEE